MHLSQNLYGIKILYTFSLKGKQKHVDSLTEKHHCVFCRTIQNINRMGVLY